MPNCPKMPKCQVDSESSRGCLRKISRPTMASQREVDVLDSWEDIEQTDVLEKSLNKLISTSTDYQNTNSNMNGTAPLKIILTGDDALRSQYVPPEPTVKILKRPAKEAQNSADVKSFQPKKTLQQREQEYAQARLRILGEAQSAEKSEERICTIQNKNSRPVELENVIRLPKGPDGTKGFNMRR